MSEAQVPPPATPQEPTPETGVDLFIANTRSRMISEARGMAQKDFLIAQEQSSWQRGESGNIRRKIAAGVRSMGREVYLARKTRAHLDDLKEASQTDSVLHSATRIEGELSQLDEAVVLSGAVKDELVALAKSLRDERVEPAQRRAHIEDFLKEHKNDQQLCEAFGVKSLSRSIRTYASVDMESFVESIHAQDGGIDAVRLYVADMHEDKSRAYGSRHNNKLNMVAATSLTVAAIKTAGVRIPATVIRHVPGVGSALAGAGLGAVRGYSREGMNQIHKKGNEIKGGIQLKDAVESMKDALDNEDDPQLMRGFVAHLLPHIELQQQYGVSMFRRGEMSAHHTATDDQGNEHVYSPEDYFTHLFAQVVHKADIGSMSDDEKKQLKEHVAKRQAELQPQVENKLKDMKKLRRRKAAQGAIMGAVLGPMLGYGGEKLVHGVSASLNGLRDIGSSKNTAVERPWFEQTSTPDTFQSTTTAVPRPPSTGTSLIERPSTSTTQLPPVTPPQQPEIAVPPVEPPQAPSIPETPTIVIPEAITAERMAVIESFRQYEVQPADNITWIIKDHLLQSHPELTYGQLDQPPHAELIQNAIIRLAQEKGVSVESLNLIHPGENPFEGVDVHQVFDPLFMQFDQAHPVLAPHEAVEAIVLAKPEHVVVNLPVAETPPAQLDALVQQQFETHLQNSFGVAPAQAHAITQELITPQSNGYIPEGSLLDFVNRGAIDGRLIAHYDPQEVVGVADWRSRVFTVPEPISTGSAVPGVGATRWLQETLATYLPLRGAQPATLTDHEIASLYMYMQENKKRTLSIYDLDEWYQQTIVRLHDVQAVVPTGSEQADGEVVPMAIDISDVVTNDSPDNQVTDEALRSAYAWYQDNMVTTTAIGSGGVATIGGLVVWGRHRKQKTPQQSVVLPDPTPPHTPPATRQPRVIASPHTTGRSPVDPSWPAPERRSIFLTVPEPDQAPPWPVPASPLATQRVTPAPQPDIVQASPVDGLTPEDMMPLNLGEPIDIQPHAIELELPTLQGDGYKKIGDAQDWLESVRNQHDTYVGLSWKEDGGRREVIADEDGRVTVRMDGGATSYGRRGFAEHVAEHIARSGATDFRIAPPAQTTSPATTGSEVVTGVADNSTQPSVTSRAPQAVELMPGLNETDVDLSGAQLSRPSSMLGQTIYLDGKPIVLQAADRDSNELLYTDTSGREWVVAAEEYFEMLNEGRIAAVEPDSSTS